MIYCRSTIFIEGVRNDHERLDSFLRRLESHTELHQDHSLQECTEFVRIGSE